jgi:hypothetical protein
MRVKKIFSEIPADLLRDAKINGLGKFMADADAVSFVELRKAVGSILQAEGISTDDVPSMSATARFHG